MALLFASSADVDFTMMDATVTTTIPAWFNSQFHSTLFSAPSWVQNAFQLDFPFPNEFYIQFVMSSQSSNSGDGISSNPLFTLKDTLLGVDLFRIAGPGYFQLRLEAKQGSSWLVASGSTLNLSSNTRTTLGLRVKLDPVSGSVLWYVNGGEQMRWTGNTLAAHPSASINRAHWGCPWGSNAHTMYYAPECIITSGDENPWGMRAVTHVITGNNLLRADWTGSAADVSESVHDRLTAITTTATGSVSTFPTTGMPTGSSTLIRGVRVSAETRSPSGSTDVPHGITLLLDVDGTLMSSSVIPVSSSYIVASHVFETNVATGGDFRTPEINAGMEIGVRSEA